MLSCRGGGRITEASYLNAKGRSSRGNSPISVHEIVGTPTANTSFRRESKSYHRDTNARPVAISTLKALHARIWFAVHDLREGVILREGCRYAGVNGIHSPDAMTLSRTRLNIKERNNAVPGCLQPSTMSRKQSSPEAADNQSSAH